MERIYNSARNEVIEAALDVMERFDRLHLRFSFNSLDASTTQVLIVVPEIDMSEENKQRLYTRMFDELERRLLFKNQGTLRTDISTVGN